MKTSAQGIAALKEEEGEVLRAYRDVVGVWTIGVGLTAASGVIKPKAGMTITREQSTALLAEALRRNYEPAVEKAMTRLLGSTVVRPKQHEFDAGVGFHFNTGAIDRASWVGKWLARAPRAVILASLNLWNKGGGKVLPGLVSRREREGWMLLDGIYPRSAVLPAVPPEPVHALARWALPLTVSERVQAFMAFEKLGYDLGKDPAQPWADGIRKFQGDHGLTVDGIIGRATLSTLQRRLNAPAAAAKPAAAAAVPAIAATDTGSAYVDALGASGAGWVALGLVGFWGLSTAWHYRDVVAAKITRPAPRLATFLRSF